MFTKVITKHIKQLHDIVGKENVLSDKDSLCQYSSDETEDLSFLPEVVVKPGSAEQISQIMNLCNKEKIPVTPRGAGTGLSGGALPVFGGVIVSTGRLNKIIPEF